MRNLVKGIVLAVAALLLLWGSASAMVEGVRVSTPDTCWYQRGFIAFPIAIEWTTWTQHPPTAFPDPGPVDFPYRCNDAEYWVHPSHDVLVRPTVTIGYPGLTYCNLPTDLPDSANPFGAPDETMCGFEMTVTFDEDVLQAVNVSNSELLTDDWGWGPVFYEIDNARGIIHIASASADCEDITGLDDPTTLIWIGFYINGSPGENADLMVEEFTYNETDPYYVFIDNEQYYQDVDEGIPGSEQVYLGNQSIGDFLVCEFLSASGQVLYMANGVPICGADVTLYYHPDTTLVIAPVIDNLTYETQCVIPCEDDCRGSYYIPGITGGYDYSLGAWHDDEDAYPIAITAFDASLILRHIVGAFEFREPFHYIAADVSGSCEVSSMDASLILQYLVGEFDYFPKKADEETNWLFVTDYFTKSDPYLCPEEQYWFEPMEDNHPGHNFWAVVLGDVSGNWGVGMTIPPAKESGSPVAVRLIGEADGLATYELSVPGEPAFAFDFAVEASTRLVSVSPGEDWITQIAEQAESRHVVAAGVSATTVLGTVEVAADRETLQLRRLVVNETNYGTVTVALKGEPTAPRSFALHEAYPNPFNPATTIGFALPQACQVTLTVYDILGREVKILASGAMDAGEHNVTWDGTDRSGRTVATGVYLYRLTADGFTQCRKMMLLK
ncbi:MAG TPA: FlgD immunoglobulin-like domain containing protein [candidate division Zixibacteria bacterium]|nr:T9SS type A sorting domain-containing protein [candidate division Zixibacteria bacterium]MDD4917644.1 FlgD immunoglobulin-like domain containing protein [candidate division Zixibacteria bacterium]MDM7974048.1 FlgD immunoglobulin-like domain containing protein [candidate division Zixibacteria bacterium]HOD65538.1 FlgD immunoglobulin-like domain containing protein [candidate division Zixibacteria bacterium]HPI31908.1 FlgD immunoglobulin-like domain containing protein [candidate division Zixiba